MVCHQPLALPPGMPERISGAMLQRRLGVGFGGRKPPGRCRSTSVRGTSRVAGHETAVRTDTASAMQVAGGLAVAPTASGAAMPIRASRPWMGETPMNRLPGAASGRIGMGHAHPTLPRGSLRASNPVREGQRRAGTSASRIPARRCPSARRPAGRRMGPPPPRSGAQHPSGTDRWSGSDPEGTGAGDAQTHLPPNPYQALGLGGRSGHGLSAPYATGERGGEAERRCRASG